MSCFEFGSCLLKLETFDFLKQFTCVIFGIAGGPGPLCQAWSNEARHNGGCNLGCQVVYLQHHGHDEGDVQTLVMKVFLPWVFVSSCWCLLK